MDCPLCRHELKTKHYHEDELCWVADCATHGVPMCVLKRHTPEPTPEEERHMRGVLGRLFPGVGFRGPASIKNHYHLHKA